MSSIFKIFLSIIIVFNVNLYKKLHTVDFYSKCECDPESTGHLAVINVKQLFFSQANCFPYISIPYFTSPHLNI